MAYEFEYKPWVEEAKEKDVFPFSFSLNKINESLQEDFFVDVFTTDFYLKDFESEKSLEEEKNKRKENLLNQIKIKIKEKLFYNFDFFKYLNKYSKYYNQLQSIKYIVKANVYGFDDLNEKIKKSELKNKVPKSYYFEIKDFKSTYQFNLVTSIEELKNIFNIKNYKMSFDTETTGLDPENDYIIGFSFSIKSQEGYYVPVKHDQKFDYLNLGEEALEVLYHAMLKAKIVYMFNSRFDMRMMEYSKFKFDMSKIKFRDVQVSAWFADPDFRHHSLKKLEKHFLGYYRPDLLDTLKNFKTNIFNTMLISPEKIVFYAAQDAISTFELGEETEKYQKEFGLSGEIDQSLLYPLMKVENHGIRINLEYLKKQLDYINQRLKNLNESLFESIGNFNLNSAKQRIKLFESFGLDTGEKTKTNNMATGTKEIEAMIEDLEKQGKEYPEWLKLLGERTKLEKLQSTFFGSLLEQATMSNGRVRINYRNTQAATGRLSSGADFGE